MTDIEEVGIVKKAILEREHILDTLDLDKWQEQIAEANAKTAVAALQSAGWLSPADATAMAQAAQAEAFEKAKDACWKVFHRIENLPDLSPLRVATECKTAIAALTPSSGPWQRVPEGSLDERLKANGMLTVEQCLEPASKFHVVAGMTTPEFFEQWLERKCREYISMHARYELGEKEKDELYEWVLAHMGAFKEVLVNYRAMLAEVKK